MGWEADLLSPWVQSVPYHTQHLLLGCVSDGDERVAHAYNMEDRGSQLAE